MTRPRAVGARAPVLDRLAGLLRRGVPLPDALASAAEATSSRRDPDLAKAVAAAREGRPLDEVLAAARLATPADAAVLRAAAGGDPARALRLLADEAAADADLAARTREVLARPVRKAAAVVVLVSVLAGGLTAGVLASASRPDAAVEPLHLAPLTFAVGLAAFVGGLRLAVARPVTRRFLELLGREAHPAAELIRLHAAATFLRAVGTALGAGLPLAGALERAREALAGRLAAEELEPLVAAAREGAGVTRCLGAAPFLDPTAEVVLTEATGRVDLPTELLALAGTYQDRFRRESDRWVPVFGGCAELAFLGPLGVWLVWLATGGLAGFLGAFEVMKSLQQ